MITLNEWKSLWKTLIYYSLLHWFAKTITMPLKPLLRITFELWGGLKEESMKSQTNSFSIIMEHTNYINLMIIKSFTQSSQYYRKITYGVIINLISWCITNGMDLLLFLDCTRWQNSALDHTRHLNYFQFKISNPWEIHCILTDYFHKVLISIN